MAAYVFRLFTFNSLFHPFSFSSHPTRLPSQPPSGWPIFLGVRGYVSFTFPLASTATGALLVPDAWTDQRLKGFQPNNAGSGSGFGEETTPPAANGEGRVGRASASPNAFYRSGWPNLTKSTGGMNVDTKLRACSLVPEGVG